MFKIKNKFKFGSDKSEKEKEKEKEKESVANDDSGVYESRKTLSVQSSSNTLTSTKSSNPSSQSINTISNNLQKLTIDSATSASSAVTDSLPNQSTSTPGLLTIKLYNSANLKLPIKINNIKQVLMKLAENCSNTAVRNTLISNINKASQDELNYSESTSVLPTVVSIPNNTNIEKSLIYLVVGFDNNVSVIEPTYGVLNNPNWNTVSSFDVSRNSVLNFNLFIRLPSMLIPESEKTNNPELFLNNYNDLLIGSIKIPLVLNSASNLRLINHEVFNFTNLLIEDSNMGSLTLSVDFKPNSGNKSLNVEDFDLLKVIGKGSFGKVMQVRKKDTKKIYALKTIRKAHIVSRMEVTHTLAERTVLAKVNNPFIVPLKFSFQSPEKLYLVLAFINGGELFHHLQKEGKFSLSRSRFYISELLTSLECLHGLNVIYRDLKPENILLDYQGHIALCDFGLCKLNMELSEKTNTFCGTPEYLAPELLLGQGYTRVVDWWTLGVLLYEMLTGLPPYYDEDIPTMYRKILQEPLRFPSSIDKDSKSLLIGLLNRDPKKRLGVNGASEIKSHPFFANIDWNRLLLKGYTPPFKPPVMDQLDTSNFDAEFTSEKPADSVVDDFLSESVQKQFGGWTYTGGSIKLDGGA